MADLFDKIHADTQAAPPGGGDMFDRIHAQNQPKSESPGFLGALWEGVGGKALVDLMGGASRDPAAAQKSIDTLKAIGHGFLNEGPRIMKELDSAGEAVKRGDWERVAHHLAGAAPLIGAPVQQAGSEVEKGDYAAAAGHTAALFAPVVADKAPGVAAALADTDAGAAVIGGAKGAGKALIETKPVNVKGFEMKVPTTLASAAAGGTAAAGVGLPKTAGAVVGGAIPVVRGAITGAKVALAERLAKALEAAREPRPAPAWQQSEPAPIEAEPAPAQGAQPGLPSGRIPGHLQERPPRPATQPEAPVAATPAEDMALLDGLAQSLANKRFSRMTAAEQQGIRDIAARSQVTQQPQPAGPIPNGANAVGQQAPAPPAGPGKSLAQMLQEEVAAQRAQAPPAAPPPAEAPAPAAAPKPPSIAQQEAWMAQKGAPPIDTQPSPVHANGEPMSAAYRGERAHAIRRTEMAKRFAETLYHNGEGLTSQDLSETAPGRTSQMQRDAKVSHGWGDLADAMGENEPSKDTVAEIIHYVREMEKAKSSIPGSRESKVTAPVVAETRSGSGPTEAPPAYQPKPVTHGMNTFDSNLWDLGERGRDAGFGGGSTPGYELTLHPTNTSAATQAAYEAVLHAEKARLGPKAIKAYRKEFDRLLDVDKQAIASRATAPAKTPTAPAKRADQMTRAELAKQADLSPDATTQEIMAALAKEMEKAK